MTCPAFRTLLTVADHALNFAAFLVHPIAGWNAAADELYLRAVRPHGGAEQLAEAEAERDVAEPDDDLADQRAKRFKDLCAQRHRAGLRVTPCELWDCSAGEHSVECPYWLEDVLNRLKRSSPATGHSLPPIPDYPAFNRSNPDSSCATGEAQCCGPAAQESPAAGFEWLTPPAAGQPNHPPK